MEEARRRARRRRLGYAAIAFALALTIGTGLLVLSTADKGAQDVEAPPQPGSTAANGDLLMLRVITTPRLVSVNSDTGVTQVLPIELPCGDTPYCLIATGDDLVISGVGRTTVLDAAEIGSTHSAKDQPIGNGWITVPSQESGTVWLGILEPGERASALIREYRQVDLDGTTLRRVPAPDGAWAQGSVNQGLLYADATRLRLWSFEDERFTLSIPARQFIASVGDLVASCDYPCERLALTDIAAGRTGWVKPPRGYGWISGEGAFSPDARRLVVPVTRDPERVKSHRDALAVVDVPSGTVQIVPGTKELDSPYRSITWSASGDRLFFVASSETIHSYRVGATVSRPIAQIGGGRGTILEMTAVPSPE